jgi:ketosteroid isomerase-like protein
MKAILVIFAVVFVSCCAVGQTMNQKANRNSGVEQELRSLESQWQEALTRRDVAMLDRLMADDYVLTTVSGEVVNKARVLAEVKSVNATADVRNTEVAVRVYGDVAIVTGLVLISGKFNDKDVSTRSRYIKVYVKRERQWRVVAAQATLIAQQ